MDYKNLEMLCWLVSQFRKARENGITFDELKDLLEEDPIIDKEMTKRTFHSYLNELRERFGITITCEKRLQFDVSKKRQSDENRRYRYRIVEESNSDSALWTNPFLMAFETSAAMRQLQNSEEDKKYMYIDCKATGVENVNILLEAIRHQKCVDMYYHDYKTGFPYWQENFEPRGLVQKDYVWYLLGHTNYRSETIWPLYLLSDIKIKDVQYRPIEGFSSRLFWNAHKKQWIDTL